MRVTLRLALDVFVQRLGGYMMYVTLHNRYNMTMQIATENSCSSHKDTEVANRRAEQHAAEQSAWYVYAQQQPTCGRRSVVHLDHGPEIGRAHV